MNRLKILVPCFLILLLSGCGADTQKEFWIYTSIYKEVFPHFEPHLKETFPDVTFRWYQAGSENIAAKILAEHKGGRIRADLIMTSDLFFYQELKRMDLLIACQSENFSRVPEAYRDRDGTFAVSRFPLMVLAYNKEKVSGEDIPKAFSDLLDPRYKGRITMPSPLQSGSTLTAILFLHDLYGQAYFEGLRTNDVMSAGGNGSTLSRIQSGERPVGMVLLENILKAKQSGLESVAYVLPAEGVLPIPSPIAALKGSGDEALARRVLDWFLTDKAQAVVVEGWVHSVFPDGPAPPGAPKWTDLPLRDWDLPTFSVWSEKRQEIKSSFQQVVLQ